jgi:hypothetical protein
VYLLAVNDLVRKTKDHSDMVSKTSESYVEDAGDQGMVWILYNKTPITHSKAGIVKKLLQYSIKGASIVEDPSYETSPKILYRIRFLFIYLFVIFCLDKRQLKSILSMIVIC